MKRIGDIGIWDHYVPTDLCQRMIDHFESSVVKTRTEEKCVDTYMFLQDESLRKEYALHLRDLGDEYFEFYGHNTWRKQSSPIQMKIQKAEPDGGFVGLHWEQGQGELNATRYAAWMTYLNTVEKGGKTVFPLQERLAVTPQIGTTLIWPAAFTHPHHSFPDLCENKYILTGWFTYRLTDPSK